MVDSDLEVLETKIAYQDETIERLSDTVYAQARELSRLDERCRELESRVQALIEGRGEASDDAQAPPHY